MVEFRNGDFLYGFQSSVNVCVLLDEAEHICRKYQLGKDKILEVAKLIQQNEIDMSLEKLAENIKNKI